MAAGEAGEASEIEVLVEFEDIRHPLRISSTTKALEEIAEVVRKATGKQEVQICTKLRSNVILPEDTYYLRRWSKKFDCFVDLTTTEHIQDGDHLTLNVSPSQDVKELACKGVSIATKLKQPSKANSRIIRTLFPASSEQECSRKRSLVFDPTAECVATSQQKKKKKAIRYRVCKVSTFVVPSLERGVPRGNYRKDLKQQGKEVIIEVKRDMSSQEVKNEFIRSIGSAEYSILSCTQSGKLVVAQNQDPTGDDVVDMVNGGKSSIYVINNKVTKSDSKSAAGNNPGPSSVPEKAPSSSHPILLIDSSDSEWETEKTSEAQLAEFRRIRAQQDKEYAESLAIDKEKAAEKARKEEEEREQSRRRNEEVIRIERVRSVLHSKFESLSGNVKVSFRLENGSKIAHSFLGTSVAKDLFEFVFAYGQVCEPFSLMVFPRREIPLSDTVKVEDLNLGVACLLTVGVIDSSLDILQYLKLEYVEDTQTGEPGTAAVNNEACSNDREDSAKTDKMISGTESTEVDHLFLKLAKQKREDFAREHLHEPGCLEHLVRRSQLYEDVLNLYSSDEVALEYPLQIEFDREIAFDQGGVSRDMIAGFWEQAYKQLFDGSILLTPAMHPQLDMTILPKVGRIISHGYIACGFLPVRVAFPTLVTILKGPASVSDIPDNILIGMFPDSLTEYEANVVRQALSARSFDSKMQSQLIEVLSRFGCRDVPAPHNLKHMLLQVCRYEFLMKPLPVVSLMFSGIPAVHSSFWNGMTVEDLHHLYLSLTASPVKVIESFECTPCNPNEERVFVYLKQFVGNMNHDTIRRFLRFATGSSVCLANVISVTFNSLHGFSRRPISHTCDCLLELPSSYTTFPEFVGEFEAVLSQPEIAWTMDGI